MTVDQLLIFLGWCTVINTVFLLVSTVAVLVFRDPITSLHSKLVGIDKTELPVLYFKYLGNYKIVIIAFNLAPYLALRMAA